MCVGFTWNGSFVLRQNDAGQRCICAIVVLCNTKRANTACVFYRNRVHKRPGNRCTMGVKAWLVSCAILGVFCGANAHAQLRDLKAVSSISQTSISWDRSVTGGDPLGKLPFNDSRLANTAGGLNPSQVRSASNRLPFPCTLCSFCEA